MNTQQYCSLTRFVMRFAWVNVAITVLSLSLLAMVTTVYLITPPKMLMVDERGNVLGHYALTEPDARPTHQLIAAGAKFISYRLSFNAETIDFDVTQSLLMMAEPLQKEEEQKLIDPDQSVILKVKEHNFRSHLEYEHETLQRREGEWAWLRYQGEIYIDDDHYKDFDVALKVKIMPINTAYPHGIEVWDIEDIYTPSES